MIPAAIVAAIATLPLASAGDVNVNWYQTGGDNDRLTAKEPLEFQTSPRGAAADVVSVSIDRETSYQSIVGFGGALTQSSAYVYKQLPSDVQKELMTSYYSAEEGLGFSVGRLPIHSCDFSVDTYTFDDVEGDTELLSFDDEVLYDQNLSLPMIKDALNANPSLKLFGSPWSPPAWMKDNNDMLHGGKLLDEYREAWANYFSRWIDAYENQGVGIWGVTVQNEPEASQSWESCIYTAEETRDFVGDYLGPVLKESHPSVKIFGFDHNKDHVADWAETLLGGNSSSAEFVDGIAFHWYSGACFENVAKISEDFPEALLLPSEATYELTVLDDDEDEEEWLVNGTWSKGEGYGYDILGDLESGGVGWTDWNIVLDQEGGPNHVGNYCDAAVVADLKGSDGPKLYYHPQYYYMGHFSKFLKEGAKRVKSTVDGVEGMGQGDCSWPYGKCNGDVLHSTAWEVDGELVVVVLNCGDDDKQMELKVGGIDGIVSNQVAAHTIQTYVL